MEHLVEYIRLRHNSAELQEKLKAMGYYPLPWTIDHTYNPNQIIVGCGYPYTVEPRSLYSKEDAVTYHGSFWNGGLNTQPFGEPVNCKDFGDDEDAFLECASRLNKGMDIFFDENWENEVPAPSWWTRNA